MNTLFRLNNHFFEAIDEYTSSKAVFAMFAILFVINIVIFNHHGENILIEHQEILRIVIVAIGILSLYIMVMLGFSILKILIENRFYGRLKRAIINEKISDIQGIKNLMVPHNISRQQVLMVLYRLHEQAMIGKELSKYDELLKSLINSYNKQETIENIPDSLLYTLNKIKPEVKATDMEYLIVQLQDTFSRDKRKMQIQYVFTLLGFIVGLFGLLNATQTIFQQ